MSDPVLRSARRMGDRGALVECADGAEARGLLAALVADPPAGVVDVVAGARTVLVRTRRAVDPDLLADLATRPVSDTTAGPVDEVVVDVVYDGADLTTLAAHLGTGVDAVVGWHTSTAWTAAFLGFAPGFAYLEPDVGRGEIPRRAEPRTTVPAGSVALAGRWSAVYPRRSPGGWQLIGRTEHVLWDLERVPPAVLTAGARVRFRPARPRVSIPTPSGTEPLASAPSSAPSSASPFTDEGTAAAQVSAQTRTQDHPSPAAAASPAVLLEIVTPGPLTVVEDLGRTGRQSLGVPTSGALDRGAALAANRLVGNYRGAAVLETSGGLVVRPTADVVVALTGTTTASVADDAEHADPAGHPAARSVPGGRPLHLAAGRTLHVGGPVGARAYLAVRGGIDAVAELESRSTDLLSGLGPAPLRAGDVLPVAAEVLDSVALVEDAGADPPPTPLPTVVRVVPGPREDWFEDDGAALISTAWRVTDQANRVGLRLEGGTVPRRRDGELESEPMVPGAVQVPPGGRPVVLLADHPTTGGYPVVAVVVADDLDRLAQVASGDVVRFVPAG